MGGSQDRAGSAEHDPGAGGTRDEQAHRVSGGRIEGQELGGAPAAGSVGTHGEHEAFVEESGQGAAQVRARGAQGLAQL